MIVKVLVKEGKSSPIMKDGVLIVCTTAKRENNQANIDIISQLSKFYGVSISDVKLIKGRTNRNKVFSVKDKE